MMRDILAEKQWLLALLREQWKLAVLWGLFTASLLFRFVYIFVISPMGQRFSDPARHWENGLRFLHPGLFGSADPLMYQVYLAAVQYLSAGNETAINFYIGVLSALMPWLWFKALDEILPRAWALAGGTLIALMPSLIMIYSYFMNETLMLDLIGAAIWLTLRAMRQKTLGAFAWAAVLWALASYTRSVALPLAAVSMALLLFVDRRRLLAKVGILAVAYGGLAIPACWHSQIRLHYCAPFGFTYLNQIYRLSEKHNFTMNVKGEGRWGFGSPNYYHPPLEPFSDWSTPRTGEVHVEIDPAHGRDDWEAALERVRNEPKPLKPLQDWGENVLDLFFDPSWPDNNSSYWMGWLSMQSRWLILPMTLFIAALTLRYFRSMQLRMLLVPGMALLLMGMLLVQQRFIVEGRYRKAVEPLLIAACVILLYERQLRRHTVVST